MAESLDPQLPLKKRARRRLVGAIAFAGLAAVVLPMVMDDEPKPQEQDVQISIPGQDQTPFNPPLVAKSQPAPVAVQEAVKPAPPIVVPVLAPTKSEAVPLAQPPAKPAEKKVEKKAEKIAKPVDKPAEKAVDKHAKPPANEPQRAAAILDGKPPENAASNNNAPYVILIGAFANPVNVKQLQSKIGDLGIKTFTEPLDSPQGKKTRVRAGPFPNREAAEKALERIKRIGVSGVVAAK